MAAAERTAWFQHLLQAATTATDNLRARNYAATAGFLTDLDALCVRLRRELDELK